MNLGILIYTALALWITGTVPYASGRAFRVDTPKAIEGLKKTFIVEAADPAKPLSTLYPAERYQVLEVRKQTWYKIDIPGCDSCWVDSSDVKPISKPDNRDWVSHVYALADPTSSAITVYLDENTGLNNERLETFLIYGPHDAERTESLSLRGGSSRQIHIPISAEVNSNGNWTIVITTPFPNTLGTRLSVQGKSHAFKAKDLPQSISLSEAPKTNVQIHLSGEIDPHYVRFIGDPELSVDTNDTADSFQLSVDQSEWEQRGRPMRLEGLLYYRTAGGDFGGIPLSFKVGSQSGANAFSTWPFVALAGFVVVSLVTAWFLRRRFVTSKTSDEGDFGAVPSDENIATRTITALEGIKGTLETINRSLSAKTDIRIGLKQEPGSASRLGNDLGPSEHFASNALNTRMKKMEDEISSLRLQITDLGSTERKRLEAERDHFAASLQGLERRTRDFENLLADRDREINRLNAGLVFLEDGAEEIVKSLVQSLENLEKVSIDIIEVFRSLDALPTNSSISADEVIDSLFLFRVRNCRLELENFLEKKFSGSLEFIEQRAGQHMSGQDVSLMISDLFYHRAVADRWDKTLRTLQKFYSLVAWAEFSELQTNAYKDACHKLHQYEDMARRALIELGIRPLELTLLKPIPREFNQYVEYQRRVSAPTMYPRWQGGKEAGTFVMDVLSWAYLNEKDQLWRGRKAQLVVSE